MKEVWFWCFGWADNLHTDGGGTSCPLSMLQIPMIKFNVIYRGFTKLLQISYQYFSRFWSAASAVPSTHACNMGRGGAAVLGRRTGGVTFFDFRAFLRRPPESRLMKRFYFLARVSELGMSIQNLHTNWHGMWGIWIYRIVLENPIGNHFRIHAFMWRGTHFAQSCVKPGPSFLRFTQSSG